MLFPIIMCGNSIYGTNYQKYNHFVTKQYYINISQECNELKKKNIKLESNCQDAQNEINKLEKENEELRNKVFFDGMRKNTIDKLKKTLSDIKVQLETKSEENKELLYIIEELKTEKEKLNSKQKEMQQELLKVAEYKNKIKNILDKNQQLENKILQVQKDNKNLQNELSELTESNNKLTGTLKLDNIKIQELTEKNNTLNKTLLCNQNRILDAENGKKKYIENLLKKIEKKREKIDKVKQQMKCKDQKVCELEKRIKELINDKKRFNNLQIVSHSMNINNIREIKQDNKKEEINKEHKDNNNTKLKNISDEKQYNKINENNNSNVQVINNEKQDENKINLLNINNCNKDDEKITSDKYSNEITQNKITEDRIDKIDNKKIEDNKNTIQHEDKNEIILNESDNNNIIEGKSGNTVKKTTKGEKKEKKIRENNNINLNQNNIKDDEKLTDAEDENDNKNTIKANTIEINNHEKAKNELLLSIVKKYEERIDNIKYLKDTINNTSYELPIEYIVCSAKNYDNIQKENETWIKFYFNKWRQEDGEIAATVSPNSIDIYQNNYVVVLPTKDHITYRNLIFFMIGKILEVYKYNYDAKNVNKSFGLRLPLMEINNYIMLSFFPKNNIQNCVDLINNNIYYSVAFYDKCKNPILSDGIFENHNNIKEVVELLENNIEVLNLYLTEAKEILSQLERIKDIMNNQSDIVNLTTKENKTLDKPFHTMFKKFCYRHLIKTIIMYSYIVYHSECENPNKPDSEYKKVIEILSNQLLSIINIKTLNIDEQKKIINSIFDSSIEQFMPYIRYWAEFFYEQLSYYDEDYKLIHKELEDYIKQKQLSFEEDLTIQNITDTINDFLQNQLKLKYTFTFENN